MRLWTSKSLRSLMEQADEYLSSIGYTPNFRARYRIVWQKLFCYAERENGTFDLGHLANQFFQHFKKEAHRRESYKAHVTRALRILNEYANNGTFAKQPPTKQRPPLNKQNELYRRQFFQSESDRGLASSTMSQVDVEIYRFLDFIEKQGINVPQITSGSIHNYCIWRKRQGVRNLNNTLSWLRNFMRFLIARGTVSSQLLLAIPAGLPQGRQKITPLWSDEDIAKLISAVDRSTDIGKRDYAILILAIRLGLRPCDMRGLRFENIHWRKNEIAITQSKTGCPIQLPLPKDVGESLIDYIQNARPASAFREIFLTCHAPITPYRCDDWSGVVYRWAKVGNIDMSNGKMAFRSFRHGLATKLLKAQVSFSTISSILGHRSASTTKRYARIDIERLRIVTLELEDPK